MSSSSNSFCQTNTPLSSMLEYPHPRLPPLYAPGIPPNHFFDPSNDMSDRSLEQSLLHHPSSSSSGHSNYILQSDCRRQDVLGQRTVQEGRQHRHHKIPASTFYASSVSNRIKTVNPEYRKKKFNNSSEPLRRSVKSGFNEDNNFWNTPPIIPPPPYSYPRVDPMRNDPMRNDAIKNDAIKNDALRVDISSHSNSYRSPNSNRKPEDLLADSIPEYNISSTSSSHSNYPSSSSHPSSFHPRPFNYSGLLNHRSYTSESPWMIPFDQTRSSSDFSKDLSPSSQLSGALLSARHSRDMSVEGQVPSGNRERDHKNSREKPSTRLIPNSRYSEKSISHNIEKNSFVENRHIENRPIQSRYTPSSSSVANENHQLIGSCDETSPPSTTAVNLCEGEPNSVELENNIHPPLKQSRSFGSRGETPIKVSNKDHEMQMSQTQVSQIPTSQMPPLSERVDSPVGHSVSDDEVCLDEEDRFVLHLAVLTLYKDQIKPQQIEIKHRLQELHCSAHIERNFLQMYEDLGDKYMVERTVDNATIYLRETPSWFSGWVDMRDVQNPYPLHVWLALDSYISSLLQSANATDLSDSEDGTPSVETRGGRYGMSKRLKTDGPAVFHRYSLGQVCHIVQLAVHLGLLSYDGGSLMPAARCRSLVRRLFPPLADAPDDLTAPPKQHPMERQHLIPVESLEGKTTENDDPGGQYPVVVDLAEVQKNLRVLLNEDEDEFAPLLLSQLKFRFLHKFKRRLDPVYFGFTRLSDFLAEKCGASCRLVREGGRQVLVDRIVNEVEEVRNNILPVIPEEISISSNDKNKNTTALVSNAPWLSSDPNADRTTRSLLAVVAKHHRFHSNITFSFWQFCAENRHSPAPQDGLNDSVEQSSEASLFSHAGCFMDFLFASILRPASTDAPHTDIHPGEEIQPQLREIQPELSVHEKTNSIPEIDNTATDDERATHDVMFKQMFRLQWFTRRPLVERQLGNRTPLSDEDIESLQDVFFSVLPPRLPSGDSNRAPRPSKLRRQISAQIAQLRRDVFLRAV